MNEEQQGHVSLRSHTDEQLFVSWRIYGGVRQQALENIELVEMEMRRRMTERQATVIAVDGFKAMMVSGVPAADPSVLVRLKEHKAIPASELAKGLTPAHYEVVHVQDKWDLRIVKTWASFGQDVAAIIEKGIIRGPDRLRVVSIPNAKGA